MWHKLAWAGAALVLLVLSACSSVAEKPLAPLFELTDHSGRTWGSEQARGKVVALTFLYTHCFEACPVVIVKAQQALANLDAAISQDVVVAVITVDPERDTVEDLREYARPFSTNWLFLTGTPGQLKTTWDNYGIQVKKGEEIPTSHPGHVEYEVSHTIKVVLIDKEGRLAAKLWGDGWPPEELAQKLTLLSEGKTVSSDSSPWRSAMAFLQKCGPFYFADSFGAIAHAVFLLTIPVGLFGLYKVLTR